MKFTLPTLMALFTALPALAYELPPADPLTLSQDLAIVIVTPWTDAYIKGNTGVTGDEVKVDDQMYYELDSFSFKKDGTVAGASFALWRESWKNHYLGCRVRVKDDLNIPILHIVFEGDGDDWKARGNRHEDKVILMCDKIDKQTKKALE